MGEREVRTWQGKALAVLLSAALCFWLAPAAAWGAEGEAVVGPTGIEGGDIADDGAVGAPSGDLDQAAPGNGEDALEGEGAPDGEDAPDGSVVEVPGDLGQDGANEAVPNAVPAPEPPASDEGAAAVLEEQPAPEEHATLSYAAHVRSIGWQSPVGDGQTAGTTGRALRVEALKISVSGVEGGSVSYRAYVQGSGWQEEVSDGAVSGTTGQSRRIEAVRIALNDVLRAKYDVYYRVHVSNVGWLGWAGNGEKAGTTGYGHAIEAVQVRLVERGGKAPAPLGSAYRSLGSLAYSTHVANVGWQDPVADGQTAGTTGRGLAVEALRIEAPDVDCPGGIAYSAHVANLGWCSEVGSGSDAGTTGRALRMEAVRIRLTDDLAQRYDVYYQAHVQNYGWLDWASNGDVAGSTGLGFRLEALRIKLVEKGGAAPGATARPSIVKASVSASAHVQRIGWQSWRGSGTVGTTGQSLALEALQMKLSSSIPGGISYRLHVQDIGWQDWASDGATAGTTGRSLRAEAVSIKLTGEAASYYDVYYRAHSEEYGWLGWAKNGANAGTATCSYRLEAIQVVLVGKNGPAPGSTSGAFRTEPKIPVAYQMMNARVNGLSSPTGWLLAIDSSNCLVGVYRGSRGHWTNAHMWSCSPGKASTPTVRGLYSVGLKGYSFGSGYTCYYWTQFYGDYLFHSELYYPGTFEWMEGTMGVPASHGCVRLPLARAKWIYDTIPTRTTVLSY